MPEINIPQAKIDALNYTMGEYKTHICAKIDAQLAQLQDAQAIERLEEERARIVALNWKTFLLSEIVRPWCAQFLQKCVEENQTPVCKQHIRDAKRDALANISGL